MILVRGLGDWLTGCLQGLKFSADAVAYVTGVLANNSPTVIVPRSSVVLAFCEARRTGDFARYQRLGDETLFVSSVFPEAIVEHRDLIVSLGSLSYYACYRLTQRQWTVYEELADQLPLVARAVKRRLDLQVHR